MKWNKSINGKSILTADIPAVSPEDLAPELNAQKKNGCRPIVFKGIKENNIIKLYIVLADDKNHELLFSSCCFEEKSSYSAVTASLPEYHLFERVFYEETGVLPLEHPWLKPVKDHKKDHPFFKMDGEEVHEVAVGPVHAGIIEPGHFRFMCQGETIYSLEIMLGYQHRRMERLFLRPGRYHNRLAESIAGDTVIGHNLAYTMLMEELSDTSVPQCAELARLIALELERIAIHLGDLGALANDIAYLMGSAVFGALRTTVINTMLDICGSRFGRGFIKVGGVNFPVNSELASKIKKNLAFVVERTRKMFAAMMSGGTVLSRLDGTGIITPQDVDGLGLVGMAARASGCVRDIRSDHPHPLYQHISYKQHISPDYAGDVFSRTMIRYDEILKSYEMILSFLALLEKSDNDSFAVMPNMSLRADRACVVLTEGWRGEIAHFALTDDNGTPSLYSVKDPSFNNWYALAIAVRGNGISDFPLCNKSFNLSYCGHDL